jgi:hypothetical protein
MAYAPTLANTAAIRVKVTTTAPQWQGGSNTIRELRPPQNARHNIMARANPQSEEAANKKHE